MVQTKLKVVMVESEQSTDTKHPAETGKDICDIQMHKLEKERGPDKTEEPAAETKTPMKKQEETAASRVVSGKTFGNMDALKTEEDNHNIASLINVTLMMANAAQIREVVDIGHTMHHFYAFVLALLVLSVVLQLWSAVLMLFRFKFSCPGRADEEKDQEECKYESSKRQNSNVMGFMTLFTVIANILIVGFTPNPNEDYLGAPNFNSSTIVTRAMPQEQF